MKLLKVEKLLANLLTKYVIHIINLKQALNHRLFLKKVHKVIEFNQNACLKHRSKKINETWLWKRAFLSW